MTSCNEKRLPGVLFLTLVLGLIITLGIPAAPALGQSAAQPAKASSDLRLSAVSVVSGHLTEDDKFYYSYFTWRRNRLKSFSFNQAGSDGAITVLPSKRLRLARSESRMIVPKVIFPDKSSSIALPTNLLRRTARLMVNLVTPLPEKQVLTLASFRNWSISRTDSFVLAKSNSNTSSSSSYFIKRKTLKRLKRHGDLSVIGIVAEDGLFTPLMLDTLSIKGKSARAVSLKATVVYRPAHEAARLGIANLLPVINSSLPVSEMGPSETCMCPLGGYLPKTLGSPPSPVCEQEPLFEPVKTSYCVFQEYGKPCLYVESEEPFAFEGGNCYKIGNYCGVDIYRPDCDGLVTWGWLSGSTPELCASAGVVDKSQFPTLPQAQAACYNKKKQTKLEFDCFQTGTIPGGGSANYSLEIEGSCSLLELIYNPDPSDPEAYCSTGQCRVKIQCLDESTFYLPSEVGVSCVSPDAMPTGTQTEIPTDTPSESPTGTATESPTDTPSESPTGTATESPTDTPSESPTGTASESPTDTLSESPTGTASESPTDTPSPEYTHTPVW